MITAEGARITDSICTPGEHLTDTYLYQSFKQCLCHPFASICQVLERYQVIDPELSILRLGCGICVH